MTGEFPQEAYLHHQIDVPHVANLLHEFGGYGNIMGYLGVQKNFDPTKDNVQDSTFLMREEFYPGKEFLPATVFRTRLEGGSVALTYPTTLKKVRVTPHMAVVSDAGEQGIKVTLNTPLPNRRELSDFVNETPLQKP